MSASSPVDFGFGWDPTIQVGEIKEIASASPKPTVDVVDEKIAFLEMQQAIMANDFDKLRNLIATVPLKIGQQRTLCRLTLKHFTPQLSDVLKAFPWGEIVKEEHMLSAIKKDQHDAFTFMLSYLNTYQFKRVYHHIMDVNANNFALYDKYRPAIFARLIPEHQQDVTKSFAVQLRSLKPNKVEAYYNLAASLAHMDWKDVFAHADLYHYTGIDDTWGWGWLIKEFSTVREQYNNLSSSQSQMVENIGALLGKIVLPGADENTDSSGFIQIRRPENYFTPDFLQICKEKQLDVSELARVVGEQLKLSKTHGVSTQTILLTIMKNPSLSFSLPLSEALKSLYQDTYKTPIPLPLHMLATPLEKVLANSNRVASVLRLLNTEDGRTALQGYFKNPLYLRTFAHHVVDRGMEVADLNKVVRHSDLFRDENGNTLMHFVAPKFFTHMDLVKQWVVNPKLNWEEKNICGFSPKDIAYQHYGTFTQSLLDDGENIFNERANNLLNKNLKQQLAHKAKPSFKRKM